MRRLRHALSGTLYEAIGDGRVRVTRGDNTGLFQWTGEWVEGDLTQADLHMLVHVGGPELPEGADQGGTRPAVRREAIGEASH